MATTVRPSDSIGVLDLSPRAHNALWHNNVREVGELVNLSDPEFLRMRGVGPGTLEEVHRILAEHGLSMRSEPLPPPDPAAAARAEWIGRQLDALLKDDRSQPAKSFLNPKEIPRVKRRRYAWSMYRWAANGFKYEDYPKWGEPGSAWEISAMPGSLELHLEGLNRIAHEELDA